MIKKTVTGQAQFLKGLRTAPAWVREAAEDVADGFEGLIQDGFAKSRGPDGKRWAPLVLRKGKPLDDTGKLKNSWRTAFRVGRAGGNITFTLGSTHPYAAHHQRGTGLYGPYRTRIVPTTARALHIPGYGTFASVKGSPKRPMIPEGDTLPKRWANLYIRIMSRAFEENVK